MLQKRFKLISLTLAFMLAIGIVSIPVNTAQAAQDGTVRVLLSSMGSPTYVSIKTDGVYSIDGRSDIPISSGKSVTVSLTGGKLVLNSGGTDYNLGTSFTLREHVNNSGTNLLSFYNPKYGNRSYMGSMIFSVQGSYIRMVSSLHIEDYIEAVIPHEMSNAFPLEALKAQAVAARSYATKRMKAGSAFDINDTSNDQVYKGWRATDNVAHQAVRATAGVVLTYQGQIIDAYYSSSNGGQTELPGNVWTGPNQGIVGCYAMVEDPYDVRNPESDVETHVFAPSGQTYDVRIEEAIKSAVVRQLSNQGMSGLTWQQITLTGIQSAQLLNPRVYDQRSAGISRFYTQIQLVVTCAQYGAPLTLTIHLQDNLGPTCAHITSLYSLTTRSDGAWQLTSRRWGHGVGLSQRGAQQMANEGQGYAAILSFYYPGAQQTPWAYTPKSLTERPTGSSGAGGAAVARGTVKITSSTLNVRKTASTSAARVALLNNGSTVDVLGYSGEWAQVRVDANTVGFVMTKYLTIAAIATPAPEVTPPPVANYEQAIFQGFITLQNDARLRVRMSPNASAELVAWVENGSLVDILAFEGEWSKIRQDSTSIYGYVMTQYITMTAQLTPPPYATPAPTPVPTPVPTAAPISQGTALRDTGVKTGRGSYHNNIVTLKKGDVVDVLATDQYWTRVRVNGSEGYVFTEDLKIGSAGSTTTTTGATPKATAKSTPKPTAKATAKPSSSSSATITTKTAGSSVTVRAKASSDSERVGSVKDGTKVTVVSKGSSYSQIKVGSITGYVSNSYLKF